MALPGEVLHRRLRAPPHGRLLDLDGAGGGEQVVGERTVIVAGGGPVGAITALAALQKGFEVILLEAATTVSEEPRAATVHRAGDGHRRDGRRDAPLRG
ncbi:MAG: FAD-dependent monooxygenase [Acidimicrobiales bacterium]